MRHLFPTPLSPPPSPHPPPPPPSPHPPPTPSPCTYRLPRSLVGSPLRPGDDILEINGVPIVDQDQKEVSTVHV